MRKTVTTGCALLLGVTLWLVGSGGGATAKQCREILEDSAKNTYKSLRQMDLHTALRDSLCKSGTDQTTLQLGSTQYYGNFGKEKSDAQCSGTTSTLDDQTYMSMLYKILPR